MLATICDRQAASFTKLPVQGIEEIVKPKDQQQTAFENLKQASAQAADELKTSCAAQTPATPVARLEAASNRLQALVQAVKTVRPTLGAFYASLGDEQKARFNISLQEFERGQTAEVVGRRVQLVSGKDAITPRRPLSLIRLLRLLRPLQVTASLHGFPLFKCGFDR